MERDGQLSASLGHRSGDLCWNVGNMAFEVRREVKTEKVDLRVMFTEALLKAMGEDDIFQVQ